MKSGGINRKGGTPPPLLILLFLALITAAASCLAQETYPTAGVVDQSSYYQDGTGVWAGRTGALYQRAGTYQSYFPIVADVDRDNKTDIIMIDNANLIVLNYTSGVGFVTEYSVFNGNPASGANQYYATPAVFDFDSDGYYEIISFNYTHMLTFQFNGSHIVLNQSAATNLNATAVAQLAFKYPVIKCATAPEAVSGNATCALMVMNRTSVSIPTALFYNVDDNVVSAHPQPAIANGDTTFHNTHLFDGNGDGFVEAYWAYNDLGNGDLYIYSYKLDGTNISLYKDAHNANKKHTDIYVGLLDGITPSVTFGWQGDTFSTFDFATLKASDLSMMHDSYCGAICPGGDDISANLFNDYSQEYGRSSFDACYYVHDYDDDDEVFCASAYTGFNYERNAVNNAKNFTGGYPIIHEASMTGNTGLLTPRFILNGVVPETVQNIVENGACIPVDYQVTGTLDFICANSTRLAYHDDSYTNQNVNITGIQPQTGNPVCAGETLITTISISDYEGDSGTCFIHVTYANSTEYQNTTAEAFSSGATSVNVYFTSAPASVTNYILEYSCRDQYHTAYNTRKYTVSYSNQTCGGNCNCAGQNPPLFQNFTTPTVTGDTQIDEDIDATFGILFGTSTKMRNIVGIGIIIGVIATLAFGYNIRSGFALAFVGILTTILVTMLGLLSAYILILILVGMLLTVVVTKMIGSSGGE